MNIALLGTGLMGRPIAERLQAAGHSVMVYNRTKEKAEGLRQAGITLADRAEEAIQSAACVITVLADARAFRDLILSTPSHEALAGRTFIQMGTIGPTESRGFQQEILKAGGEYVEAPVLGSIAEVRAGTLIVMVGATRDQFEQWLHLFRCVGEHPRLIGPVGKAAALKLALNQLIAAEMAAFALSLGLIQRAEISHDAFMDILRQSALYAPTFDKKLPRLLQQDYTNPNFSSRHMLKDVELFLKEAETLGLNTSSLEGVPPLLKKAIAQGLGDGDYSAIFTAINPAL
jgi:3-hydroxyisobutyrate dehydrogenase